MYYIYIIIIKKKVKIIMRWKNLFASRILDRGYCYYEDDYIESFTYNNGEIQASVLGSDEYDVVIEIENDKITYMECTCPYAENGSKCKHMAAVLYKFECEDESTFDQIVNINEFVNRLSEQEVRNILIGILDKDKKLYQESVLKIKQMNNEFTLADYKIKIDSIILANFKIYSYEYDDYYDNYDKSYDDFVNAVNGFLNSDMPVLLKHERYWDICKVIEYLIKEISSLNVEIDMEYDEIYDECLHFLSYVIERTGEEYKAKLETMIVNLAEDLDDDSVEYLKECILHLTMKKEEYFKLKNDKINLLIENGNLNDGYVSYELNNLLNYAKQNKFEAELEQLFEKYWGNHLIKQAYIDRCIENNKLDEAVKIIKENIEFFDKRDMSYKLKEIYKTQNNKEGYEKQLFEIFYVHNFASENIFEEIKLLYSQDEWIKIRENIFIKLKNYNNLHKFLYREKQYDKLIEWIQSHENLHVMPIYAEHLKHLYPQEVLQYYHRKVIFKAQISNCRDHYAQIATHLNFMLSIEGSYELVKSILESFRITYKRKKAMMDELNKVRL